MRLPWNDEVDRREGYEIRVVGSPPFNFSDVYHLLLRVPWWVAIAFIVAQYLSINLVFATLYLWVGGIEHAAPGSFADAFDFSIQTLGSIGYGEMYPATHLANALVATESVCSVVITALSTGLVFARFSHTRARVAFSRHVVIGPFDGTPTLMIRIGNERRGRIMDAAFQLTVARNTVTAEGSTVYRYIDVPLLRERAPSLTRAWMVMHPIRPGSPFFGETAETLAASELELTLQVTGVDETLSQPVHAQHTWSHGSIVWNARLADVLSETQDGNMLLDLRRFHELEARSSSSTPHGD